MHPGAKVGHQIAEGPCLPALIEGVERLGDTVCSRRDLIGVDRVELLPLSGHLEVPEDQGAAADERWRRTACRAGSVRTVEGLGGCARFETRRPNGVHHLLW